MAKVLIVDDDVNNRTLLSMLLEHAGHTPLEAGEALTAQDIAEKELPDLVVVDLTLPGISGVELMRRLRANSRTAHLRLAVYSAIDSPAEIAALVDTFGVQGIVPKPGDPHEILSLFQTLLSSGR